MISSGYTKLFGSIVASSIWNEDDPTRIVWITMLALSDKDGYVAGAIPGLATLARVGIEDCKRALEKLQQPDEYSRSPEYDGRRIEVVAGGWLILNRAKYRDLSSSQDKAERHRQANRRYYQNQKAKVVANSDSNSDNCNPNQTASDGFGDKKEKEKEKEKRIKPSCKPKAGSQVADPPSNGKAEANPPDERHEPVRTLIQLLHKDRFEVTCQWDGSEAAALKKLLKANPSWKAADLMRMVRNRFASDINADRPRLWLPDLGTYTAGPLDRYNKPKAAKSEAVPDKPCGLTVSQQMEQLQQRGPNVH